MIAFYSCNDFVCRKQIPKNMSNFPYICMVISLNENPKWLCILIKKNIIFCHGNPD